MIGIDSRKLQLDWLPEINFKILLIHNPEKESLAEEVPLLLNSNTILWQSQTIKIASEIKENNNRALRIRTEVLMNEKNNPACIRFSQLQAIQTEIRLHTWTNQE